MNNCYARETKVLAAKTWVKYEVGLANFTKVWVPNLNPI